jgi:hypothetical protein
VKLIPVSFEELSGIEFTVALAPHERNSTPEFLLVTFTGAYRHGAAGADDATFIAAIMEAAQRAWYTDSLIIDLSELAYYWGDEMDWIHDVGHDQLSTCHKPLAIIVGDDCRHALKTLAPEEYEMNCVESFDDALNLIRRKLPDFERRLAEWRQNLFGRPRIATSSSRGPSGNDCDALRPATRCTTAQINSRRQ